MNYKCILILHFHILTVTVIGRALNVQPAITHKSSVIECNIQVLRNTTVTRLVHFIFCTRYTSIYKPISTQYEL